MTKPLKAEIIAVGTELLLGQIANTNAQWLSKQFAATGINVYQHAVVGDNLDRVTAVFAGAQKRSDIILVTGGLGPTEDDLTREAFQKISGLQMVEHASSMKKIETFFKERQMDMTPNNRKQARVFAGAKVLENKAGMAPGMIVEHAGRTWIFLPGVPREMKWLTEHAVLPYLQQVKGMKGVIKSAVLKFIGIGESLLEDKVSSLIQAQSNPTIAPLAQEEGVVIRLTAKADTMEEADELIEETKQQILAKVGKHFVGMDEDSIEEQVVSLLKEKHKQIAAAESLTGGMFTERLVSVEGASKVCAGGIVSYTEEVKKNVLGVSEKTIRENGTVSRECAMEMAERVRQKLGADIGISFTGVAGPEEVEGHPAGTVFIAIMPRDGMVSVEKFTLHGTRNSIRKKAVLKGLQLIFEALN
ncbi:competence/damage-inducible protein A [Virgibacillus xinjiangensis]|uniref:Putative competence-damage inducible protein n=1 Tax=Virgibacillus xinjiangensis TaxID=393090 RepID=A0ABV7CUJ0_9BACI